MKTSNLLLLAPLGLLLAACSSMPDKTEIVEQTLKAEQANYRGQKELEEQKQQDKQKELEQIPQWYLNPPANDATGYYGAGDFMDPILSNAITAAKMKAARAIAFQIQGQIHAETNISQNRLDDMINATINGIYLQGMSTVHQQVIAQGDQFHVFVLLKMSKADYIKIQQQLSQQQKEKK